MGNNVLAIWATLGVVGVIAVAALIMSAISLSQESSEDPIFKTNAKQTQKSGKNKTSCNCLSGGNKF